MTPEPTTRNIRARNRAEQDAWISATRRRVMAYAVAQERLQVFVALARDQADNIVARLIHDKGIDLVDAIAATLEGDDAKRLKRCNVTARCATGCATLASSASNPSSLKPAPNAGTSTASRNASASTTNGPSDGDGDDWESEPGDMNGGHTR